MELIEVILSKENLNRAYKKVVANKGASGVDGVTVEELGDYILSCHGNQKEYLVDKYTDFKKYVEKKLAKPMTITKEAGVLVCRK